MVVYEVKLFKDLVSSDGQPFHCLQSIVEVEADSADRAVKTVLKDMRGPAWDWIISVSALQRPKMGAQPKH